MPWSHREYRYAHEVEHHGGHVEHGVGPVAPAGEKSVEVAENFLGPQIDATLSWISMRKLDHRNPLRPEEKQKRDDPEPDRHATVSSDRGDNVQVEHRNHKQKHQVPASQDPLQMWPVVGGWIGQKELLTKVSRFHVSKFQGRTKGKIYGRSLRALTLQP